MSAYKYRIKTLIQYKDLIKELVSRDLKLKYRRSILGYVWSILNPLLIMIVMTVVFSAMFQRNIENYPVYLLIGLVGVPVFSGFSGGLQKLIGVTGGYLVGYLPCALLTGLGTGPNAPKLKLPAFMVLGTVALYLIGTAWFMIQTKNPLGSALGMCVIPFLPGDAIKIVAASLLAQPIRKALYRE